MSWSLGCSFSFFSRSLFGDALAGPGGPVGCLCLQTSLTRLQLLTTARPPWCTAWLPILPYRCCSSSMCQLFSASHHNALFHPEVSEKLASFFMHYSMHLSFAPMYHV